MENTENNIQKIISTDTQGDFLRDVSLWNLIGNSTVNQLKVLVESYHNDKSLGRNPKYPHVVFVGKKGSGRTTLAHAYANSMGASEVFRAEGSTLSLGGQDISMYLEKGSQFSAYLIQNSERLSFYCNSVIVPALQQNVLIVRDPMNRKEASREYFDRLMMFACEDATKINPQIVNNVTLTCYVGQYSQSDILQILNQRLDYLNWSIIENQKVEILNTIKDVSNCDISLAIKILGWMYKSSRALNEETMTLKHLNMSLRLLNGR